MLIEYISRIKMCWPVMKMAWKVASERPYMHYHIVGGWDEWELEIVTEEMQKAQKKYRHRLRARFQAFNRPRTKTGQFKGTE